MQSTTQVNMGELAANLTNTATTPTAIITLTSQSALRTVGPETTSEWENESTVMSTVVQVVTSIGLHSTTIASEASNALWSAGNWTQANRPGSSVGRAMVHFTYYQLNLFDIVFMAFIFFVKFFITSLLIIFALVSINDNSYRQLLERTRRAKRMWRASWRTPGVTTASGGGERPRRKDLLFAPLVLLAIVCGDAQAFFDYISSVQRFLYVTSFAQKCQMVADVWRRVWRTCSARSKPMAQSSRTPTPSHVVFIDSEPALAREKAPIRTLYRPTVKLRVKNETEGSSVTVRCLLEPNSTCSYISANLVQQLRLHTHFVWPCFWRTTAFEPPQYVYQATVVNLQPVGPSSASGPPHQQRVELLIASGSNSSLPYVPQPSNVIAMMAQDMCGVRLSDTQLGPTSDPEQVSVVIGQDLLYSIILRPHNDASGANDQATHQKIFLLEQDLCLFNTAFGWTLHGIVLNESKLTHTYAVLAKSKLQAPQEISANCNGPSNGAHIVAVEARMLPMVEPSSAKSRKCSDATRILCYPMQLLVWMLVLTIYMLMPCLDSLLYLYNILFHLALAFALVQIASLVISPAVIVLQYVISTTPVNFSTAKRITIAVHRMLTGPLILLYRFSLAAIWLALYWFLSMGKALLTAQCGNSSFEWDLAVRIASDFEIHLPARSAIMQTVRVAVRPGVERSTINFQWLDALQREPRVGVCGKLLLGHAISMHRDGCEVVLRWSLPNNLHPLGAEQQVRFRISDHSQNGSPDLCTDVHLLLGSDLLSGTGDNPSTIGPLVRRLFLLPSSSPPQSRSDVLRVSTSTQASGAEEQQDRWALEHRFYPHGWRAAITCRHWLAPSNLAYLPFFLLYILLLAAAYFCLMAPNELTLISARPTVFRHVGNFIFFAARLRA